MARKVKIMKLVHYILPFLALALVVFLGFQHKWYFILSGDIKNYYYPIANHVFTAQTLIYPPGANLFFLLLPKYSFEIYQLAFIGANIIFLVLLLKITKKPLIFCGLVLCAGPIILFRFDLLVILLLVLAILAFKKGSFLFSGLFMGLATITKLFPVILLPYFLLLILSTKKYKEFCLFLASFIFAVGITFFFYAYITNQNLLVIIRNMNTVLSVSVHMESVIGSLLTIITGFTNPGPHGVEFINAIWVLSPLYFLGHARIFKLISPFFLVAIYAVVFLKYHRSKILNISTCLLVVLSLLITSQLLSPQYILWPAFLLLLLPEKSLTNLFLIFLALICTQVIYPLNYGELIDFYNLGINQYLFFIIALRNLLLVIVTIRLFVNDGLLPFLPKK